MTDAARDALALRLAQIVSEAGRLVMASERTATLKPDQSPVTAADKGSERLIRKRLQEIEPGLAIVAEESFDAAQAPTAPDRFALIDPLDGTREFVAGGDEFTVNIAVIENGKPVVGAVYAPARRRLYLGGAAAFRADVMPGEPIAAEKLQPIATRAYPTIGLRALVSRSHPDTATQALLDQLPVRTRTALGSSLKFCVVAEGSADVYPRLARTMEWDTAAGHAVLLAAGGTVIDRAGQPLRYGKPGFRNDGFLAWGREPLPL